MQIVVKRDPPNTIRCPYMPQHLMHVQSFLTHLTRCKATNKNQFKICPFNSYHVIPKDKFMEHKQKCVNRIVLDDEEEWQCRGVMERAFIAGCGGEDPSNFKDSDSSSQSFSDSSWLPSQSQFGNKYGFYQFMDNQNGKQEEKNQKNVFKKQKQDQLYSFGRDEFNNSEERRQFNRNFYDYCVNQHNNQNKNKYQKGQYYGYNHKYNHSPEEQYYREPNFYRNRDNFTNKYDQPTYKGGWNRQKPKPHWLIEVQRERSMKTQANKAAKAESSKIKKNQKADDDQLLYLIDQIDKNIRRNQFDNDSVSDEFGNQLAKQASFIRNKGFERTEQPKSSRFNTGENGRNLYDY